MAWVETGSRSFTARHEAGDRDAVEGLLDDLERHRDRLERALGTAPGEVAVVVHDRTLGLLLAAPWLPLARLFCAPAGRRYYAGWFSAGEIHVLGSAAIERRASGVPGSIDALRRSARHEYAHLAIAAINPLLPPPFTIASLRRYVSLAWAAEGGAAYLAGQVTHLRPAIARRLREGRRPRLPVSPGDALLLGGSVFSLLEREQGPAACVRVLRDVGSIDSGALLERAFDDSLAAVERRWGEHLDALTRTAG